MNTPYHMFKTPATLIHPSQLTDEGGGVIIVDAPSTLIYGWLGTRAMGMGMIGNINRSTYMADWLCAPEVDIHESDKLIVGGDEYKIQTVQTRKTPQGQIVLKACTLERIY